MTIMLITLTRLRKRSVLLHLSSMSNALEMVALLFLDLMVKAPRNSTRIQVWTTINLVVVRATTLVLYLQWIININLIVYKVIRMGQMRNLSKTTEKDSSPEVVGQLAVNKVIKTLQQLQPKIRKINKRAARKTSTSF